MRLNANVRPPTTHRMLATFSLAAALVGLFAGVLACKDGARFSVGLAYACALVVAIATVVLVSTALFAGDAFILRVSTAASIFVAIVLPFVAIMFVAYSAGFAIARRLKSRRAA